MIKVLFLSIARHRLLLSLSLSFFSLPHEKYSRGAQENEWYAQSEMFTENWGGGGGAGGGGRDIRHNKESKTQVHKETGIPVHSGHTRFKSQNWRTRKTWRWFSVSAERTQRRGFFDDDEGNGCSSNPAVPDNFRMTFVTLRIYLMTWLCLMLSRLHSGIAFTFQSRVLDFFS